MIFRIFLLGIPRLEIDDQIIEIDTRKAVAILAYMALAEERPTRDFLATFLWPDFDQSRARAALRRTLSAMRRDVGKQFFEISREAVAFSQKAEIWVDVVAFQEKAESSSMADLETAVELFRDDFMAGFTLRDSPTFDEWQYYQNEQLRRDYSAVLEALIGQYSQRAEWDKAIEHGRRWLANDPLHEAAHRSLMRLLAWAGKRTEALRQYRDCVRILDEELGVAPLSETTDLFHAIQENSLTPPTVTPQPVAVLPTAAVERPLSSQIPLVGRTEALSLLNESHEGVAEHGRFIIIGGEAGIGKTRLADEFLALQIGQGTQVIMARCYEGEQGLAYGPVVSALRQALAFQGGAVLDAPWQQEIGRLLPLTLSSDLLPPLAALDSPGAQSRFFGAISQSFAALLAGEKPGILYLDDLQWADTATLDWLIYLVRRLPELNLFVLGGWRTPEVAQESQLRQIISTGQRAGTGRFLELDRLNQTDIEQLLALLEKSADIASRLYAKSEGLPFFLNAYLTSPNGDESWPDSFRDLLYSRLPKVDQTGQQLLQTAAVIGRSFDFDTLRTASGRSDDETVEAVETLLAHGLVAETVTTEANLQYDFTHQALRDLVYEDTSFARRRLLHRRVADSLSQQRKRPHEATAAQIGHHYYAAGQEALAADFFFEAGGYAKNLYANTEALSHFQTALALGHPATADLHEAIGDLQKLNGRYGAALAAYEKAAALVETADLSRVEQKLGGVYHRQGDWERAVHHFSAALAALAADSLENQPNRARILADWSRTAHRAGDMEQAQALAEESLTLAEAAGDLPALAQTHNILGMLARAQNDYDRAAYHLGQSLELAPQLATPSAHIAVLNNLALLARDQQAFSQSEQLLTEALSLCQNQGDRHREAALLNNLADLYHMAGNETAAREYVRQGVAILAEIGADMAEWQPEIWKLTSW